MFVFAGSITFTVTQNDVLKQPENFLNFYYETLTQTSINQVVSGRSGAENLFGEFESNNYGVDIFNPNLFPGISSIPIYPNLFPGIDINNPSTNYSFGDYDTDGSYSFINDSTSPSVLPVIGNNDYNIADNLSPFERTVIDFPFLLKSSVNYGTSYILAWVCSCIALLAAVFITIARSQISESLKDNSEEDSNLDKKEKLSMSA